MPTPDFLALDYETADASGMGSVEFWKPGFHVVCASISYHQDGAIKSYWTRNPWDMLVELSVKNIPIIAHNIAFEMAVTEACYPFKLNWYADTMRLAGLYDGGDAPEDMFEELEDNPVKRDGLSLSACCQRILKQADSKSIADRRIKEMFPDIKVSEYGKYRVKLANDDLMAYCSGDTELTLALFTHLTEFFKQEMYDWSLDHSLYLNACRLINDSQLRGVPVDRSSLATYKESIVSEISGIERHFKETYAQQISKVEEAAWDVARSHYKTEKGKQSCPRPEFNVGSNKQLAELFVGQMNHNVKFMSTKGDPSMRAAHLGQFGEAGLMLQQRRKRSIVEHQAERLLELSEADGRWHVTLRTHGTKTGRFAGGGSLNVQGLPRKDRPFMSCLKPDPGYVLVSSDGQACEPTITAELSGDRNYRLATLDMVGLPPRYEDGQLIIDDLYLFVASVTKMGRGVIKDAWNRDWNGKTFAEQWVEDSEVIKKYLKPTRAFHKPLVLSVGYSAGPKKLSKYAYDCGYDLPLEDAKKFYRTYWDLFPDVRKLYDHMARIVENKGFFYNRFGYRCIPSSSHKAGNFLVQSSASGLLNLYAKLLFEAAPYAQFVTLIHDEIILQIPIDKYVDFCPTKDVVEEEVNRAINWSVKVRFGLVKGKDWYEAK